MTPLNLKISNFLSFAEASIDLEDKGLVCIEGVNLDGNGSNSNGSGKSSLFIAIRWCLYGVMDKDMSADEIVNSKAEKNCMVQSTWFDDLTDIKYRITRYRKHSKHKNKVTFEIMHKSASDWTDATLGKNDLTQDVINKAIGMDDVVFTAACFASQEDALDIPAMNDKELKSLIEKALPYKNFDEKYLRYDAILKSKKKDLSVLSKDWDDYHWQMDYIERELKKIAASSNDWEKNIAANVVNRKIEIGKLRLQIDHYKLTILPNEKEIAGTIDKLYTHLTTLSRPSDYKHALEAAQRAVEAASDEYRGLGSLSACPACERPVEASDLEAYKAKLYDNVVAKTKELDEWQAKYEKAVDDDKLRKRIVDKIALLENDYLTSTQSAKQIERIEEKIAELNNYISSAGINPWKPHIEVKKLEIEENKKKLEETNEKIKAHEEEIQVYNNILEALSPKGFRFHMLEAITPELNDRTNHYLSMLTDGKIGAIWSTVSKLSTGEYKESFSIKAGMNGRTNYGSLSGGQKRKVRLACWFAIQDLIADRAEKDVKLWICDEVDGALDNAGIERLMSLLEEKAKTRGTVLVISHNNMRDWIPNYSTVTMKDDISTVSGFLNEKS